MVCSHVTKCSPIFTVRNEVAKVMFLHVSVILFTGGGVLSQHALQVVSQHTSQHRGCVLSQHALQVVSQHAFAAGGGAAPGGVPAPGGYLLQGGSALGVWRSPPKSRRLLLRTVRILECILFNLSYRSIVLSIMGDKPIRPVTIHTMLNWITDRYF